MDNNRAIEAVVFDMGGVIVELGPITDILGEDPMPPEEFWSAWLRSAAVRQFEMGQCSVEHFGERFVAEAGLKLSPTQMVEQFRSWPKGLFPGGADLVRSVNVEVAVLSNTNALHWENQLDAEEVQSLFARTYLSYQLGLAKPDADMFEHVVADLALPADRILFLDDNQLNVDGARAAGMRAEVTKGIEPARAVLAGLGLLD